MLWTSTVVSGLHEHYDQGASPFHPKLEIQKNGGGGGGKGVD